MTSPRILLLSKNIRPTKQLGQHFLTSRDVAEMIVSRGGITGADVVLEIGAGLGALTIPAAHAAEKVYAVEKDRRMAELLKTELLVNGISNVILMEMDILRLDIGEFAANLEKKPVVIGNLPYNISSQVLVKLIKARKSVERAVFMFQKELAGRITASPSCKEYGRLTAMLGYCPEIKRIAEIRAAQFYPKPAVDSGVVEIRFKQDPDYPVQDEAFLFKVIKAAFGQRRKTLKNSLSGSALGIDPKTAARALENSDIDPSRRAETLTAEEFSRLSDELGGVRMR